MRDLQADLKLCEAATRGPWYVVRVDDDVCMNAFAVSTAEQIADFTSDFGDEDKVVAITLLQSPLFAAVRDERWFENAVFIAAAREGWPEAIKRAMEAEARVAELEARLREVELAFGQVLGRENEEANAGDEQNGD